MNNDPFNQLIPITFDLDHARDPGYVDQVLASAGAVPRGAVDAAYAFARTDEAETWQSSHYAYAALFKGTDEVAAGQPCDIVELRYPLATIGSEYIERFADLVFDLSAKFDARPNLSGWFVERDQLVSHFDELVSELMEEWGEEPGSEQLKDYIDSDNADRAALQSG